MNCLRRSSNRFKYAEKQKLTKAGLTRLVDGGVFVLDAIELFAVITGFFLLGLAVYAVTLYWFSRKAKRDFGGAGDRLGEIGFYLNEFRKSASKLRAKAAEKSTASAVEKKLLHAAKEIEEEKEIQKQRERLVAVRPVGKRKERDERG